MRFRVRRLHFFERRCRRCGGFSRMRRFLACFRAPARGAPTLYAIHRWVYSIAVGCTPCGCTERSLSFLRISEYGGANAGICNAVPFLRITNSHLSTPALQMPENVNRRTLSRHHGMTSLQVGCEDFARVFGQTSVSAPTLVAIRHWDYLIAVGRTPCGCPKKQAL